jgi:hypothetical protein
VKAEFLAVLSHPNYSPPRIQKKTAANNSPSFYRLAYSSPAKIREDWRVIQSGIGAAIFGRCALPSNQGGQPIGHPAKSRTEEITGPSSHHPTRVIRTSMNRQFFVSVRGLCD